VSINSVIVCLLDDAVSGATAGPSYAGDITKGIAITGMQLETGATATAYQRVVTQYDVSEAGVEALHYLSFDGTDDSLATSAIDFTATDKMSVFAGVRRLTDTVSTIAEISQGINVFAGSFALFSGTNVATALGPGFLAFSRGTGQASTAGRNVVENLPPPITVVLSASLDIADDKILLRANGVNGTATAGDQGAGNYGNYPLYVGRRGSVDASLNGHIYGLIVRGAASSDAQITNTETWLNNKTAAY
jgi:hypothetical protein